MKRTIVIDAELLPVAVKVSRIVHSVPKIDGHFWVERNGKIIDPYFKEYDLIK